MSKAFGDWPYLRLGEYCHMGAAKHALRYLKGCSDLPITYKKGDFRMHAYTGASFAANSDKPRSTSSFLFFLDERSISFGTKTQSLTAQSAVEAEMMITSDGVKEADYLSESLGGLGFFQHGTRELRQHRSDVGHCQPIVQLAL